MAPSSRAPCSRRSPRGAGGRGRRSRRRPTGRWLFPSATVTDAAARDAAVAGVVTAWLRRAAVAVHERRAWLTDLDAAIGDGDHGINLDRGFLALASELDALHPGVGAADRLSSAGRRLLGLVGGASGALYGRGLMAAGDRLRAALDDAPAAATLPEAVARAADAAEVGALGTVPLVARKGRASYLGERSIGHEDPGA